MRSLTLFGTAILAVATAARRRHVAGRRRPTPQRPRARADGAIAAAKAHPGVTKFGGCAGTSRRSARSSTRTAPRHVRLNRTYRGLAVVGGDLVVHQSKTGAWEGSSQTLATTLDLAVDPAVTSSVADTKALAPSAVTRRIKNAKVDGSTLVVDASGATPRLAWKVVSGGVQANGTPSRLATYVDAKSGAVIRTEQEIVNVDGTGKTLYSGSVPLQVTKSGFDLPAQGRRPAAAPTRPTSTTPRTRSSARSSASGCKTGTRSPAPTTTFGNGATSNRATAGRRRPVRHQQDLGLLQDSLGRNGIFGTGKGSYNRVHYGKNYVNAFWDGTKMTYGDGDGTNYGRSPRSTWPATR